MSAGLKACCLCLAWLFLLLGRFSGIGCRRVRAGGGDLEQRSGVVSITIRWCRVLDMNVC